jgi:hypothetical protein
MSDTGCIFDNLCTTYAVFNGNKYLGVNYSLGGGLSTDFYYSSVSMRLLLNAEKSNFLVKSLIDQANFHVLERYRE